MKMWAYFRKAVLVYSMAGLCVIALASIACAEGAIDPDAQRVLVFMSNYLGSPKRFSVEPSAVDEIVTPEGEKIQFIRCRAQLGV